MKRTSWTRNLMRSCLVVWTKLALTCANTVPSCTALRRGLATDYSTKLGTPECLPKHDWSTNPVKMYLMTCDLHKQKHTQSPESRLLESWPAEWNTWRVSGHLSKVGPFWVGIFHPNFALDRWFCAQAQCLKSWPQFRVLPKFIFWPNMKQNHKLGRLQRTLPCTRCLGNS